MSTQWHETFLASVSQLGSQGTDVMSKKASSDISALICRRNIISNREVQRVQELPVAESCGGLNGSFCSVSPGCLSQR